MNTYQDLIDEARRLVNDAQDPFRDENEVYIEHINRGLMEVARLRPDALVGFLDVVTAGIETPKLIESGFPDYDENEVTLGAEFELDRQFYPPLLSYLVGMVELKDDESSEDSRAMAMLTAFRNSLLSV